MIAGRYDKFRFEQGATFDVKMTYRNKSTGIPFDFTGYTASMSFKESVEDAMPWLELTTEDGATSLTFRFDSKNMAMYPWVVLPAQYRTAASGNRVAVTPYMTSEEFDKVGIVFIQSHL